MIQTHILYATENKEHVTQFTARLHLLHCNIKKTEHFSVLPCNYKFPTHISHNAYPMLQQTTKEANTQISNPPDDII